LPTAEWPPRFRCRTWRKDFIVTSATLFASHKLPLKVGIADSPIQPPRKFPLLCTADRNFLNCAVPLGHSVRKL
jgi:hypothetical protein